MKLSELGEFGFIERIRRAAPAGKNVPKGIGDDCAVTRPSPGSYLLTTTDLLIEGIHFRRDWIDSRSLGRKSVSVNVSDIAAMGGAPEYLYLALGIPADFPVPELDLFMEGFLEATARYGAFLVGGDTCRSPGPLFVSVTAEGAVPENEVVCRNGARPGDHLYVSGTLGDSAMALRLLQEGDRPDPYLERRHHDPCARVELARALASAHIPSAMIDLSDGVLSDIGHILDASKVSARLDRDALPVSDGFRRRLDAHPEWRELALSGGEDYELLFAASPGREKDIRKIAERQDVPLTWVGEVVPPEDGFGVKDRQGNDLILSSGGFRHFE